MVGALTVAVSIALRVLDPAPVAALRGLTFDFFQRLSPRPYADLPVRIVDIDDASLAQHGQWPWPRTQVADLVQRLSELGAAAVAPRHDPGRAQPHLADPDRGYPARRQQVNTLLTGPPDCGTVTLESV
jgi:adenylate cyclase